MKRLQSLGQNRLLAVGFCLFFAGVLCAQIVLFENQALSQTISLVLLILASMFFGASIFAGKNANKSKK